MNTDELREAYGTLGPAHDSSACARAGGACRQPLDLDPLDVFGKLVREVNAGTALVTMTMDAGEQRRAALDALALARDVLEDARQLLEPADDEPVVIDFRIDPSVAADPWPGDPV